MSAPEDSFYSLDFSFVPDGYAPDIRGDGISITFHNEDNGQVWKVDTWVEEILGRLRRRGAIVAFRHEYGMYDGSLYKSVRASVSEEELRTLVEGEIDTLSKHHHELRNGMDTGQLPLRTPRVSKVDPDRLNSDLVSLRERYDLFADDLRKLKARRHALRDKRIEDLSKDMDRFAAVHQAFEEFRDWKHVKAL